MKKVLLLISLFAGLGLQAEDVFKDESYLQYIVDCFDYAQIDRSPKHKISSGILRHVIDRAKLVNFANEVISSYNKEHNENTPLRSRESFRVKQFSNSKLTKDTLYFDYDDENAGISAWQKLIWLIQNNYDDFISCSVTHSKTGKPFKFDEETYTEYTRDLEGRDKVAIHCSGKIPLDKLTEKTVNDLKECYFYDSDKQ